ncbi:hypothetical protein D7147_08095 [Micromonospora musae]|uniref:Nucleoside 2-deoxyribosyltransferase n=2 Tax=Micromonospora musae TaxID=1894970 RepID=A0ABX9RFW4_9ACTN|nr:hypothetical protein D7147_08095 [Micromonospora musae]
MKGAADQQRLCWTDVERKEVVSGAAPCDVVFLNPDDPIPDAGNTLGQFGRDMYQVMVATAVVVDARVRRGIGIGVEMAAAVTLGTPVIVVAPRNSQYRSDVLEYRGVRVTDYVHPHVAALATEVVEDFTAAGRALVALAHRPKASQPRPEWLSAALTEYKDHVLDIDAPMLQALRKIESSAPAATSTTA